MRSDGEIVSSAYSAPLTVAVLAGGRSSEHDVSLSSGAAVRDGLRSAGHDVVWVEIGRDGVWRHDGQPLSVTPAGGLLGVDVAFPVLHGPFGEDGTVQGLLETLDVAYVGAGVAASAVSLDKVLFKQLMSAAGVPQVDYVGVRAERFERSREHALAEIARITALGLPVFVKPAHLGSSVGIVKVSAEEQIGDALQEAFAYDPLAIVEAAAPGVEVECGVLGTLAGDDDAVESDEPALASEPGEIVFSGEFYDFGAKYSPGGMELRVPARISASAREQVKRLAVGAFEAAGCEGLARVDFFVDGERVLVNELNTMPGFTPTSVYAKLLAASGVAYPRLVDRLCRLALVRHERHRAYSY
ncbi:MAG TPA: D-alanine--D-alanine ligase family protein [Solirubrobacteraceae bacterium]|jgi:D-alanine-D-alanine ligase|nr:D-alanine--D-alanine ligase family protein [Solirubrobacteraceae bacterium]